MTIGPRRIALLLCCLTAVASAATVRRSDDTTLVGRLAGITSNKLSVVDASGKTVAVPLDDVAEVTLTEPPTTRPGTPTHAATTTPATRTAAAPASQPATAPAATLVDRRTWQLTLAGKEKVALLPAAWANGKVSGNVGPSLALDVPVTFVRELWRGTADQVAAANALGETAGTDDIAFAMRDGKVLAVHGIAVGVDGDALRFKFGDQERHIALARLVGVVFARSGAADKPPQAVTLVTGDTLPGTWTSVDPQTVGFTAAWGQPLTLNRREALKITARNGRVVSLSDLTPAKVEQTPYFDRMLAYQVDHALDGKPLQMWEGAVPRGIAVHSRTVLTYALDGAYEQFRSRVGFQLPEGKAGDCTVRVLGDGRTLFEKLGAKGTEPSSDVNVSVGGVQTLTLEVDFGQNQDVGDRVVWGLARLIRPQTP